MSLDQEVAFSFQSLTVGTTAVGITTQVGDLRGFRAVMSLEADQIRFRYDGTAPTATVGHLMNVGDRIVLEGRSNLEQFLAIRSSGAATDGTMLITIETM